jgi:hypothetical protein
VAACARSEPSQHRGKPDRARYEEDFYVWTERQAATLRRLAETRPNVDLEEVEGLGIS